MNIFNEICDLSRFKNNKRFMCDLLMESHKHPDTLYILPKNCVGLFHHSENFEYIGNWDTSNVENMSYMFCNSKFNGDISNWDVSNVKYMNYMFYKSRFHGNILNWDFNKLRKADAMFSNSIDSVDVSKLNLPKRIKIIDIF